VRSRLAALGPEFFSVTFGAGGSTKEGTWNTVMEMHAEGLPVAPHISCIGTTHASVRELLAGYRQAGIRRMVALRGDTPSGAAGGAGDFRYANELVEFIRPGNYRLVPHRGRRLSGIPPAGAFACRRLANFVRKVGAGADSAITQYFYNADAYFRFIDDVRALGCAVPVVAGIMPIVNFTQLARFSDACGAEIPRWVRKRLESYGDDREAIRAFGLDVVTDLCQRLFARGAPACFCTMNQFEPTAELVRRLGLARPRLRQLAVFGAAGCPQDALPDRRPDRGSGPVTGSISSTGRTRGSMTARPRLPGGFPRRWQGMHRLRRPLPSARCGRREFGPARPGPPGTAPCRRPAGRAFEEPLFRDSCALRAEKS
jgi:methylenetetrahydrofolate reductase (NADPH)